jgi:hypothetical protein
MTEQKYVSGAANCVRTTENTYLMNMAVRLEQSVHSFAGMVAETKLCTIVEDLGVRFEELPESFMFDFDDIPAVHFDRLIKLEIGARKSSPGRTLA